MCWVIHFLSGGDAVGGGRAKAESFQTTSVILEADCAWASGGAPVEDGTEHSNVGVEHDVSAK